MPGATPNYGFPYPILGESPHGPNQIEALAQAVDAKFLADVASLATTLASRAPLGEAYTTPDLVFGTTTSTSFVDALTGASPVTLAFVAPPSGKVIVEVSAAIKNSGSNFSGVAFRLSGASSRAAVDGEQIFVQGNSEALVTKGNPVSGLTPGGSYTITMQHKVTSGTGTFNYRRLGWRPLPA